MASNTVAQVQLVLRLTLGLIFLASALAKLRHPTLFVRGVLDYQVLSTPCGGGVRAAAAVHRTWDGTTTVQWLSSVDRHRAFDTDPPQLCYRHRGSP